MAGRPSSMSTPIQLAAALFHLLTLICTVVEAA
jgi:hypothetical protein